MKLAVADNVRPFLFGGAEHLAQTLVTKLREYGHQAVLLKFAFSTSPLEAIPSSILAARLTRIPDRDRVICLRFPAFYIPHPEKVLWVLSQLRTAYELGNTNFDAFPADAGGDRVREIVREADSKFLREAHRIFTNHEVTAKRLLHYNGIPAEPLLCPHGDPSRYYWAGDNDTIVAFGRVSRTKRHHLAVEAMAYTRTAVKLHVAGLPDEDRLSWQIRRLIIEKRLEDKVRFEPRFISEAEKAHALARCLAAFYAPFDEDSHGYVTLEAFYSKKPCVTCSDGGGVLSAVDQGVTGLVADPDPRAIAEAFDSLYSDRVRARRMGENGWRYALELPDKWEYVIGRLLS